MSGFGNVLCVMPREEDSIETLMLWIQRLKSQQQEVKEYPLTFEEIEAFRYRVGDVVTNISRHQVKQAHQLDFKKKMIKSPDLTDYFASNPKEKELLQRQIIKLKAGLRHVEIKLPGRGTRIVM